MIREIWVRFNMPAFHCWPGAPEHRDYLRNLHRHLFCIEVRTRVDHNDRDIEFHDLLDESKRIFLDATERLPFSRSCEEIAEWIALTLTEAHRRDFAVSVSEDNECGAIITSVFSGK